MVLEQLRELHAHYCVIRKFGWKFDLIGLSGVHVIVPFRGAFALKVTTSLMVSELVCR